MSLALCLGPVALRAEDKDCLTGQLRVQLEEVSGDHGYQGPGYFRRMAEATRRAGDAVADSVRRALPRRQNAARAAATNTADRTTRTFEWNTISEAELARLNDPSYRPQLLATQAAAALPYRQAPLVEAQELRVRMPGGHEFTRVVDDPRFGHLGVAWDDGTLLWSAPLEERMSWEQARLACKRLGGRLPTKGEFETLVRAVGGAAHLHLLPGMRDHWFWSSSVHPVYSGYAYYFNGRYGDIYNYYRDYAYVYAVRCVSRR